ncbi:phage tail protein [Enterobacter asburiae]|nr:phage tail protein [Enterobacter asburiae]
MSKTFSWATQVSPSANEVVNLLTSQFGDGYEQVAVIQTPHSSISRSTPASLTAQRRK